MNKFISILICSLLLCACGEQPSENKTPINASKAIYLVWENGGVVADDQKKLSKTLALNLLQQLTTLARHKATRGAVINIIETGKPNVIAWSGTPDQLLAQAEDVKALLTFKQGFSDLVLTYHQIEMNIDITRPGEVWLYHIGPFINAGFQDVNGDIEIKLPQSVPSALALANFADRLSVYKLFMTHPDQIPELIKYFGAQGILARKTGGKLDFKLMGAAQARSNLSKLL